ncbi:hypothetical protein LCGC14_2520870, partial [marine sediment metagenome]
MVPRLAADDPIELFGETPELFSRLGVRPERGS